LNHTGILFEQVRETNYPLNTQIMFTSITSEITIETGSVLKEIATGRLFEVGKRLKNDSQLWGDDPWEITEITPGDRTWKAIGYLELAEKYHAEVEDSGPEH